jgi:phosphopantothenoylcysteine decarboxylase/phosphopantothenate--cysteine ligase
MNILIGVTGGIAAYKTAGLVRLFVKNGDSVKVVMTENACRFITPLTMRALSRNDVYIDMFGAEEKCDPDHIDLVKWADVFVIAPASANTIAKTALGLADNLLTTTVLSYPKEKKLFIAPAMNTAMWEHEATKRNMGVIGKYAIIIGPESGSLACGDEGIGAMSDPEDIFSRVCGIGE